MGHHYIQHDKIGPEQFCFMKRFIPVFCGHCFISLLIQVITQYLKDIGLIISDQDFL